MRHGSKIKTRVSEKAGYNAHIFYQYARVHTEDDKNRIITGCKWKEHKKYITKIRFLQHEHDEIDVEYVG